MVRMTYFERRQGIFPGHCCALWIATALILSICCGPFAVAQSRNASETKRTIFVTSNGWHTGIVVAKEDIPTGRLPETADFLKARFFEFGWGDAAFYRAKEATLGLTLNAAFVPTPAVMHVAGMRADPARTFPEAEVLTLPVNDDSFRRLIDFVDASFERSGEVRALTTGPGLYPFSRFYWAKGSFHLFNTCNTWTARALDAAGFNIDAAGTVRAEALMQQVRDLGIHF